MFGLTKKKRIHGGGSHGGAYYTDLEVAEFLKAVSGKAIFGRVGEKLNQNGNRAQELTSQFAWWVDNALLHC